MQSRVILFTEVLQVRESYQILKLSSTRTLRQLPDHSKSRPIYTSPNNLHSIIISFHSFIKVFRYFIKSFHLFTKVFHLFREVFRRRKRALRLSFAILIDQKRIFLFRNSPIRKRKIKIKFRKSSEQYSKTFRK